MHVREGVHRAAGWPTVKYFGKWPFTRVLGMQEPASVAFSLMNMGACPGSGLGT